MEIINNDTFDVTLKTIRHTASVAFNKKRMYISKKAAIIFGLNPSYKMHIAFDADRMYLYFNEEKSGFNIRYDRGKALTVESVALYETLRDRKKNLFSKKFPLRVSMTKINESKTIEVLLHKKIN